MRMPVRILILAFPLFPSSLSAQSYLDTWTVGLQLDARVPLGELKSRPSPGLPNESATRTDTFKTGMGGRVFATGGLSPRTAFRVLLESYDFGGSSPGQPNVSLSYWNFAVGGGLQFFFEPGRRPKGFYLLADLTYDRESFTAEHGSPTYSGAIVPDGTREVGRMGGAVGLGWIARNGFTVELGYHRSLTGSHDIEGTFNSSSNHFNTLPSSQSFRIGAGYTWRSGATP
jgi:hypothetical protein